MTFVEWWDKKANELELKGQSTYQIAQWAWVAGRESAQLSPNKQSAKCQCGADAVYHYCRICWCMEIDSQKQADSSHVG